MGELRFGRGFRKGQKPTEWHPNNINTITLGMGSVNLKEWLGEEQNAAHLRPAVDAARAASLTLRLSSNLALKKIAADPVFAQELERALKDSRETLAVHLKHGSPRYEQTVKLMVASLNRRATD